MTRAGAQRSNEEWTRALRGEGASAAEAQAELRQRVAGALRKATARFGPLDEATLEDLTQAAVLRILEKLDRFEGRSRFTTWAYSVAVHAAFSELRRSSHRHGPPAEPDETLADETADATGPAVRNEIVEILYRVIEDDLTERQQRAILADLKGTPPAELEARLGTNRNALHKLLHDARRKLRQGLESAGISDSDVRHAFDL